MPPAESDDRRLYSTAMYAYTYADVRFRRVTQVTENITQGHLPHRLQYDNSEWSTYLILLAINPLMYDFSSIGSSNTAINNYHVKFWCNNCRIKLLKHQIIQHLCIVGILLLYRYVTDYETLSRLYGSLKTAKNWLKPRTGFNLIAMPACLQIKSLSATDKVDAGLLASIKTNKNTAAPSSSTTASRFTVHQQADID